MKLRKNQRGYTLIEVMVAMGILTVSLLGTLPLVSMGLTKAVHGRKVTVAQYVATTVMDKLRIEVRTDPNAPITSGCGSTTGCTNGGEFTLANAWQSEQLPHSPDDILQDKSGEGCNPPGTDDGVDYNIGPFPMAFGENTYFVCYHLEDTAVAGSTPGSLDARVKVYWPSPVGYGSHTITGTLLGGGI